VSLFLALTLIVPALTGVVRVITGLPVGLAASTSLATVLVLFACWALKVKIPKGDKFSLGCMLLVTLSASVFFICTMYHPFFSGLPSVGGGDAGNHVEWGRQFLQNEPKQYHGFVSFYALTYWLELVGFDSSFEVYRAAFYLTGILSVVLMCLMTHVATTQDSKKELVFRTALVLCVGFFTAQRIVFPVLHYLQAEGFYPQLAATPMLLLLLLGYSIPSSAIVRVSSLLIAVVLYRYSYGLNLADVLLVTSIVIGLEAKRERVQFRRQFFSLIACAALAGAIYAYWSLLSVVSLSGAVLSLRQPWLASGLLVLVASGYLARKAFIQVEGFESRSFRMLLFSSLLTIFGVGVPALYYIFNAGQGPIYYLQKYSYHSILLISWSIVLAVSSLAAKFISSANMRRALTPYLFLTVATAILGLWLVNTALQPIRVSFEQRARFTTAHSAIEPLADLEAWRVISETLQSSGSRFGGFITPSWPQSNFTNAEFGYFGELPLYHEAGVMQEDGYCVFWMSSDANMQEYRDKVGQAVFKKVAKLEKQPGVKTLSYRAPWLSSPATISYRCFGDESS
jgi:hypothetical protein